MSPDDLAAVMRVAQSLGLLRQEGAPPSPAGTAAVSPLFERLSMERLARVHDDVEKLHAARGASTPADAPKGRYRDYRAIIHAHSHFSHDSRGTEEEILAAAKAAGVNAIFMTDHYTDDRRFLQEGLRGLHDGILFIPGTELSSGLLAFRIDAIDWPAGASAAEIVGRLDAKKGVAFIAHPEGHTDWDSLPPFTGMEIYNTHADAEDQNSRGLESLRGPDALPRWMQLISAFRQYPQESFASIFDVPVDNLARWDRLNAARKVVGIAGNDSHNNVGFTAKVAENGMIEVWDVLGKKVTEVPASAVGPLLFGGVRPAPGQTLLTLRLDPYPISYGYVSTHILAESLTERDMFGALEHGRCYVAFDWIADPTGFTFEGTAGRRTLTMGDTLKRGADRRLIVTSPLPASLRLLRDGREVARESGTRLEYTPTEPGVYRAEVWLTVAGEDRPWIYANPIRVE
jgi:hypothetical protein